MGIEVEKDIDRDTDRIFIGHQVISETLFNIILLAALAILLFTLIAALILLALGPDQNQLTHMVTMEDK
jgi:hypothetical protein